MLPVSNCCGEPQGLFASRLASHRCGAVLKINIHRKTIVGVSLLAMAVCQT